jgi:hypothetical protein
LNGSTKNAEKKIPIRNDEKQNVWKKTSKSNIEKIHQTETSKRNKEKKHRKETSKRNIKKETLKSNNENKY